MKSSKQIYKVWLPMKTGLGLRKIEANSITEAFNKLTFSEKMSDGWIETELTLHTFNEILGIEETI